MKNNLLSLLIIFLLSLFEFSFADNIRFNTKNIEIFQNENQITGGKGKVSIIDKNIEINANTFNYKKNDQILEANGNGSALINSKNIILEFDNLIYYENKNLIQLKGNAQILNTNQNVIASSENFFYEINNNLIFSNKETNIKNNYSKNIKVEKFKFDINKNIIRLINLEAIDNNDNVIKSKLAYINTKTGKIFGKDIAINFKNLFYNEDNEPRLKANGIIEDNNITEITKGTFTLCKKRDGCPPWEMSAKKIQHNKSKKIINYQDAILKIYDLPVMYFPYFFHPDPTVSRQSGFLTPSANNSNKSSNYFNIPYYLVISQNKDMTLSPRFYNNKNFLLQTEYRQKNKTSNYIIDTSYFAEKNKNNENHFFYNYFKQFNNKNFEREINLKVEQISNDTYLKSNKFNSEIINDENILENSIDLNLFSDDMSLNFNASIFENLNKIKSDRYEYTFPRIELIKQINNNTNLDGNFTLRSQASINNYNTNVLEKKNVNDLFFESLPNVTKNGFYNEYSFLIKNSNSDNKNSDYKNRQNFYVSSILQYDSSLPLIKENLNNRKTLKPKISLKFSPSHTQNNINKDTKLDVNNIYSIDRFSDTTLEGGMSMTYGVDYSIFNKNKSSQILELKMANNLRAKKNEDLPKINQMGEKISNIFGEAIYKPKDNITISYSNALKNNLKDITYENFGAELKTGKFLTTFDYLNENYSNSNNSYLTNKTSYLLNKSNSISYSIRENKTKDLTEYYKFMYQYKNDCLSASIEFNKDYYNDRGIKPNKSLLFKLNIIPFGEARSLNLLENEK